MKTKRNLIPLCLLAAVLLPAFTSLAQPAVTKISAGFEHSLFLKSDGSLWGMGRNDDGQLGNGTYNSIAPYGTNRPQQLLASNVTAIAAGVTHSLFLKSDGSLWVMGYSGYGQLGDGVTFNETNVPEQIVASNVTAIAAGYFHSLFLKSDGSLWVMGENNYGQLGDGKTANTNQPEEIVTNGVTAIAAGGYHSLFIKRTGNLVFRTTQLWAMGDNTYGTLGNGMGYNNYTNVPVLIESYTTILSAGYPVTAIAAGELHSLFIKGDGSLWAMGHNGFGQLGDGNVNGNTETNFPEEIVASNVTAIAAGDAHSLFLKSDGSLWAMGRNDFGQLGDGKTTSTNKPEEIVTNGVTAISAGRHHSLFLEDGNLWDTGWNTYGQLGDGTINNTNRPELIVIGTPGYNLISARLVNDGSGRMSLPFVGLAGVNYALDRSLSLAPPNWIPQITNSAGAGGVLVFTNAPNAATNNYWRIRSVP